jgi:hypothetical protein
MPQINPWHAVKDHMHHNNSTCQAAQSTPPQSQHRGTGNKPLCAECRKLKVLGK